MKKQKNKKTELYLNIIKKEASNLFKVIIPLYKGVTFLEADILIKLMMEKLIKRAPEFLKKYENMVDLLFVIQDFEDLCSQKNLIIQYELKDGTVSHEIPSEEYGILIEISSLVIKLPSLGFISKLRILKKISESNSDELSKSDVLTLLELKTKLIDLNNQCKKSESLRSDEKLLNDIIKEVKEEFEKIKFKDN